MLRRAGGVIDPRVLEDIAARGWPARETARLGGWRLYASSGFSGRINACWPLETPDQELRAAIEAVEAWYGARGQSSVFKIVESACAPDGLTERLAALGYAPDTETLMMTGPLDGAADPRVRIATELDPGFEAVFAAAGTGDAGDTRERLEALGRIGPPRAFARLDVAGAPAAIGACAVEGGWSGVFGMRTAVEHRRLGLGRRVFAALLDFSRAAGATGAYLQVEAANAPAIALYRAAGFEEAYRYRYWRRRQA
jgi:ribosomal protein S18 acetylase RimI-like enzyme